MTSPATTTQPAPLCPAGHGAMARVADKVIADRCASQLGDWWACPELGECNEMLLRPSWWLRMAATQPLAAADIDEDTPPPPHLQLVR
jgi:hypothetical protein